MDWQRTPSSNGHHGQGFVVPAPHSCDAIGNALRNAFKGDRTLPDEFASALIKLDRIG